MDSHIIFFITQDANFFLKLLSNVIVTKSYSKSSNQKLIIYFQKLFKQVLK